MVLQKSWKTTDCYHLNPVMTDQQRFVVLGTGGTFTFNVLQTLIKQNYLPLAYIQSGNRPQNNQSSFANIELEVKKPRSDLSQILETQNIPVYFQAQTKLPELIQQLKAEFLLVACWPELLSNEILHSISTAALNLHPSLLPKFRGADPVAEQLLKKDYNFGISLHLLSNSFDSGDIVLQQALKIDENLDKTVIEITAAKKGAALFIQAINTYEKPGWKLVRQILKD